MDAKSAIIRYSNYQERSHSEVRSKLYELGCNTEEVELLLCEMVEMNLLNEERYSKAIARGKFHVKQWGRVKIADKLKSQKVSPYCLNKALTEINEEEYRQTLQKLAAKKWNSLKNERNQFIKANKTYRFLRQKGYEPDLITKAIKSIQENTSKKL